MPTPSNKRPMISIATFWAAPLRTAPQRKTQPPETMDTFLPKSLVVAEAKKEATKAARYREDVNS